MLIGSTMVLILSGYSEIGAHVWSPLGYLICLRHLFRSRTDLVIVFQPFLIPAHHDLSYHLIPWPWVEVRDPNPD